MVLLTHCHTPGLASAGLESPKTIRPMSVLYPYPGTGVKPYAFSTVTETAPVVGAVGKSSRSRF